MPSPHTLKQNHLLAALPTAELERLLPHLELVPMPLGQALYESGGRLQHVYFPTTSIVSLLYVMEDGASAEIAVIGNDGILGISLFMGGETTTNRAVVQSMGYGYRLKTQQLKLEFIVAGRYSACCCATPRPYHADGADRGMQSAPFAGTTTLPLAATEPRPSVHQRIDNDPGVDCQYAGGAARRGHGGRRAIAACRPDQLQPWPHHRT